MNIYIASIIDNEIEKIYIMILMTLFIKEIY